MTQLICRESPLAAVPFLSVSVGASPFRLKGIPSSKGIKFPPFGCFGLKESQNVKVGSG